MLTACPIPVSTPPSRNILLALLRPLEISPPPAEQRVPLRRPQGHALAVRPVHGGGGGAGGVGGAVPARAAQVEEVHVVQLGLDVGFAAGDEDQGAGKGAGVLKR